MASDLLNATDSFYMLLRELFSRLVFSLQIESSLSMEIIAFWLWLEGNGHSDFLERIDSFDDHHVWAIAFAARRFVETLRLELGDSDDRSMPRTHFQIEAIEGISFYLNNVCYKALDDLREKAEREEFIREMDQIEGEYSNDQASVSTNDLLTKIKALYVNTEKHHGEGTSSRSIRIPSSPIPQDFNESIDEYQPSSQLTAQRHYGVPQDERTLFVTFSNGYPFTKDELYDFFMRHYGDIDEIKIEVPLDPRPPLYAHVTFYSQATLRRVLDGNKRVKFMTRGKHLWARQFVPKKKKSKMSKTQLPEHLKACILTMHAGSAGINPELLKFTCSCLSRLDSMGMFLNF